MRPIEEIIIHCAATPNGKEFHASDINEWHRNRGWDCIGYHFVIPLTGRFEFGRRIDKIGAHARGHNDKSIGVCLIGTDKFNLNQWYELRGLVTSLSMQYNEPKVIGHNEIAQKICPGFDVQAWMNSGQGAPENHLLTGG